MKKLTFKELAKKILKEEKKPLTPYEIWKIAVKKGYDKLVKSEGKTPWQTIGAQIYVSIKKGNSPFIKISTSPTKFYLKELVNKTEFLNKDLDFRKVKESKFFERDLHPLLVKFVEYKFKIFCKTIYHERSSNTKKGFNEWLYPDIVGVKFSFENFNKEIVFPLIQYLNISKVYFYSFELKKEINFSNLRQYFFQAVSNSSWANEGYLVGLSIDLDDDFLEEFNRLNNLFGIGLIELNCKDVYQSQIIFSAKTKENIDLLTVNRLVEQNKDFRDFIKDITDSLKIKRITGNFDKSLTDREIEDFINKKGICDNV